MKNRYEPWKKRGMTEAEYFKMRYLEQRRKVKLLRDEWVERVYNVAAAGFEGIRYVGAANYPERERDAKAKLRRALEDALGEAE